MSDTLRSITNFVEDALLWVAIAFVSIVGVIALLYAGLRLAMWLTR